MGYVGEGSVVFDEGQQKLKRDFLADFFQGMAALGGDDGDDYDGDDKKDRGLMQNFGDGRRCA